MTTKVKVVESLGESAVLLPSLIAAALEANDRIKLRLSMLQEAAGQAQSPDRTARDFRSERKAAGLGDVDFDTLISGARLAAPDRLLAPGASKLIAGIADDLDAMLAPVAAARAESADELSARLATTRSSIPLAESDQIELAAVDRLATADRSGPDSVHLLVMDIHKALNRLAAETAVETLDGARVHAITERDRDSVRAFMRGLNRTAPLAFGHPGLGTTAVRTGGHLTIQNDIGTTDAHVLIVHVEPEAVTVTYTDVHHARAQFFMSLFKEKDVNWTAPAENRNDDLNDAATFYLMTGRFESPDPAGLDQFLDFLGSRIVFLIDWNKARKALQTFVGKNAAIQLLTWAAEHDFGHRAFLELGGADLIFEAVHRAAAGRIAYGVRLDEALGDQECMKFLRGALRDASQGIAAGMTARLIRDEIQTELAQRFATAESSVLTVLVRHLGLTRMLAGVIADALSSPGWAGREGRQRLMSRAKRIEEKGDRLTVSARELAARLREAGTLRPVIDEVEETTDALEDCAYLLSIVPEEGTDAIGVAPMAHLANTVTASVGHLVRAIEAASRLPKGQRADAVASLQSIDAVVVAEREADMAQRAAFAALMAVPQKDARVLAMGLEIARALETATDHLSHSALSLRDRVLEELSA